MMLFFYILFTMILSFVGSYIIVYFVEDKLKYFIASIQERRLRKCYGSKEIELKMKEFLSVINEEPDQGAIVVDSIHWVRQAVLSSKYTEGTPINLAVFPGLSAGLFVGGVGMHFDRYNKLTSESFRRFSKPSSEYDIETYWKEQLVYD